MAPFTAGYTATAIPRKKNEIGSSQPTTLTPSSAPARNTTST